jgi:hypothetical protein
MHDASNGVRPKRYSSTEQEPDLTVQPLVAVKPLFVEGRQHQDSQRVSSGVGVLLRRPVDEVVKVEDNMSAIDDMLREMVLEGYVLPVAQSEVVKTLKEIRSSDRLARSHKL